jgi:tetratricopeptide (TPR) repeat protein
MEYPACFSYPPEYFERAIAASPRNAINHLFLGVCHSQLGRHNVAKAALEEALAIDSTGAVGKPGMSHPFTGFHDGNMFNE